MSQTQSIPTISVAVVVPGETKPVQFTFPRLPELGEVIFLTRLETTEERSDWSNAGTRALRVQRIAWEAELYVTEDGHVSGSAAKPKVYVEVA